MYSIRRNQRTRKRSRTEQAKKENKQKLTQFATIQHAQLLKNFTI
jgi:hypothetical protein